MLMPLGIRWAHGQQAQNNRHVDVSFGRPESTISRPIGREGRTTALRSRLRRSPPMSAMAIFPPFAELTVNVRFGPRPCEYQNGSRAVSRKSCNSAEKLPLSRIWSLRVDSSLWKTKNCVSETTVFTQPRPIPPGPTQYCDWRGRSTAAGPSALPVWHFKLRHDPRAGISPTPRPGGARRRKGPPSPRRASSFAHFVARPPCNSLTKQPGSFHGGTG